MNPSLEFLYFNEWLIGMVSLHWVKWIEKGYVKILEDGDIGYDERFLNEMIDLYKKEREEEIKSYNKRRSHLRRVK